MEEVQRLTASAAFHGFRIPEKYVQIITKSITIHKKSVNNGETEKPVEKIFFGSCIELRGMIQ